MPYRTKHRRLFVGISSLSPTLLHEPVSARRYAGAFLMGLVALTGALLLQGQPALAHSVSSSHRQATGSDSYADTVLVMDNVNHIRDHDQQGYRFDAARLYVDM